MIGSEIVIVLRDIILTNIDSHSQSIRSKRLKYTLAHENDIKDIQNLIVKNERDT